MKIKNMFKWQYILASLALSLLSNAAHANPSGLKVINGKVSKSSPSANVLEIKTGDRAILHWDDFSIKSGETTRFIQPGKSSAVLNRVVGHMRSNILGNLESNGHVYLINPNGILIGKNAYINVSSFIASTLDTLDDHFLKGKELLFSGTSKESIVNNGVIKTEEGDIYLIGYHLENYGTLSAPKGTVGMGAGLEVLIKPAGTKKVFIRPQPKGEVSECRGLENSGHIEAHQSELTADGNLYVYAIRDAGAIDALSVENKNGHIYLVADNGHIEVSGPMMAKGGENKGGEVTIEGKIVTLINEGQINTSDKLGGGKITVDADHIFVDDSSHLLANALENGEGGYIRLASKKGLVVQGEIEATGGAMDGHGGKIELVSDGLLAVDGKINTKGVGGTGLLCLAAPHLIVTKEQSNNILTLRDLLLANTKLSYLQADNLNQYLAQSRVTLDATRADPAGSLHINSDLGWNNPHTLTLLASRAIYLNAGLYSQSAQFAEGSDALYIKAPDIKLSIVSGKQNHNSFMEAQSGQVRIAAPSKLTFYPGPTTNTSQTIEEIFDHGKQELPSPANLNDPFAGE